MPESQSTIRTVDDDAGVRRTVARVLASAGHGTLEAENGKVGLEMIFRNRPDLVITDVMMPEIDGVQMVTQVRAFFRDLPIIALSGSDTAWARAQMFGPTGWGSSTDSPLSRARDAGADVTIGKPFEVQLLLDAVSMLLSRARQAKPLPGRSTGASVPGPQPHQDPADGRALYHVRMERGRWSVHREGTDRPIARAATREDAVFLVQRVAAADVTARVAIYDAHGMLESYWDLGD